MRILLPTFRGATVLIASGVAALSAFGQAKDCCSVSQQQWYTPASPEACRAAGDIHAADMTSMGGDMTKIMALQACSQNVFQQAQDAYGGQIPGMPPGGIPGMPGSQIPGMPGSNATQINAEPQFLCCNTNTGDFADGEMPEAACRALGSKFLPDTPENLNETNACHAQSAGGGGGGAWNVEDYVENIENGGMEDWADDRRPIDYTTYGVNPDIPRSYPIDIRVADRSPDAHTGQWSIKLKNTDIGSQLPPEAAIAKALLGPFAFVLPAGFMTCE